ncbi:hypothetical protein OFC13_28610, partial [Escherichia coli]|nr:hypothetical protein [Escherichia coli]
RIEPRLPPDWKWLVLRRLPYRGRTISFVVVREDGALHIYATDPLDSPHAVTACGEDVSEKVEVWSDQASVAAFARDGELCLFIGNSAPQTL